MSLLRDLMAGNRILAHHGVLDAYGHVSIRDPENPNQFILSRSRAPELVTEEDFMVFDFTGEVVNPEDKRGPYNERFIHAAIYEARPDVNSVCHSHTPSIIPFGITGIPLKPVWHQAAALGTNVPIWDVADEFPGPNMLVNTVDMGRSLAQTLSTERLALMRGHGCVFVGRQTPDVVRFGVYALDVNARVLTLAHLMNGGNVKYLSDIEVQGRAQGVRPSGEQFTPSPGGGGGREWEAWCAQVGLG